MRSGRFCWTTDLRSRGIRVTVVLPGMVGTPAMQAYLKRNAGAEDALKPMYCFIWGLISRCLWRMKPSAAKQRLEQKA